MPPFGGLLPYPYTYMAAAAAAASALPPGGGTSGLGRSPFLGSSRARLRFNPYQLPVSLPQGSSLLTTAFPSGVTSEAESSVSASRESSPVAEHHGSKPASAQRTGSPKAAVKDSTSELQNIQRLVSGLEKKKEASSSSSSLGREGSK